ncbi:hypothetical protein ASL10_04600 [Frigoribacterium sp. Leaf8]|nr:hypothetical protein ASL10_04600 [Frigoribacterium sp. Leaf8]
MMKFLSVLDDALLCVVETWQLRHVMVNESDLDVRQNFGLNVEAEAFDCTGRDAAVHMLGDVPLAVAMLSRGVDGYDHVIALTVYGEVVREVVETRGFRMERKRRLKIE